MKTAMVMPMKPMKMYAYSDRAEQAAADWPGAEIKPIDAFGACVPTDKKTDLMDVEHSIHERFGLTERGMSEMHEGGEK